MKLMDYALLALVAAVIAFVILRMRKRKKSGAGCGCGGCEGCALRGSCEEPDKR